MANIDSEGLEYQTPHSGTFGDKSSARAHPMQPGVTAVGDVLRIGKLPKGAKISPTDLTVIVATAFTASVTASFGYAAVNGDITDDPDFFIAAGADLASTGILEGNQPLASVVLDDEVYLTATLAGAANVITGAELEALCDYVYTGQK